MYSNWKTHTQKVKKDTIYYDKTQHVNFHSKHTFQATRQQTVKNDFYVFGSCFRMLAVIWSCFRVVVGFWVKNSNNKLIWL